MTYPNLYRCADARPDAGCPYTPSFPARECTSYVADYIAQVFGDEIAGRLRGWGNAMFWPARARELGWAVDNRPAVNAILCLGPNQQGASPKGHVAAVRAVGAGIVTVSQYDWVPFAFDVRDFVSQGVEFIHLPGSAPKPPGPTPPMPPQEDPPMLVIFVAADVQGGAAQCLSENLMRWRWIETPQQLTDITNLAAASGVKITTHQPATPVADIGAFGVPADASSAAKFGVAFP